MRSSRPYPELQVVLVACNQASGFLCCADFLSWCIYRPSFVLVIEAAVGNAFCHVNIIIFSEFSIFRYVSFSCKVFCIGASCQTLFEWNDFLHAEIIQPIDLRFISAQREPHFRRHVLRCSDYGCKTASGLAFRRCGMSVYLHYVVRQCIAAQQYAVGNAAVSPSFRCPVVIRQQII